MRRGWCFLCRIVGVPINTRIKNVVSFLVWIKEVLPLKTIPFRARFHPMVTVFILPTAATVISSLKKICRFTYTPGRDTNHSPEN